MDVKNLIRRYIETELVNDKEYTDLSDDDPLIDTGIIDSLGIIKLIGFLEDKLSVQVADEDLSPDNFASVETISSLVLSKSA